MNVAIAVQTQESLQSVLADDFGTAPCFVVAEIDAGQLVGGGLYDNISHDEFGCAGIAEYVKSALSADVVIACSMSADAYSWLRENGIDVYRAPEQETAAGALRDYLLGTAVRMDAQDCADGHKHSC